MSSYPFSQCIQRELAAAPSFQLAHIPAIALLQAERAPYSAQQEPLKDEQ